MNKTLQTVVGVTIGVIVISATKVWYDNKDRQETRDARDFAIYQAVRQINQSSPKMIDELTRLDSATYAASKMTTFYTLPTLSKAEIDAGQFVKLGREGAIKKLCSDSASKPLLRSGLTYGYTYQDSGGATFAEFQVAWADCQ